MALLLNDNNSEKRKLHIGHCKAQWLTISCNVYNRCLLNYGKVLANMAGHCGKDGVLRDDNGTGNYVIGALQCAREG